MIQPYPLQWPKGTARTRLNSRRPGTAQTQTGALRDQLLKELDRLKAVKVVISSNAVLRKDGLLAARQPRIDDTGVAVYFMIRGIYYVLACDLYLSIAANLKALGQMVSHIRAFERIQTNEVMMKILRVFVLPDQPTPQQESNSNQQKPPPKPPPARSIEDWRTVLEIKGVATWDQVSVNYKRLAKKHHPDKGGKKEDFQRLQDAYLQAKKKFNFK